MNFCSEALQGSNQVSITLERQADGRFTASCPNLTGVPSVTAAQESTAVEELKRQLQVHFLTGKVR